MTELNDGKPRTVMCAGPFSFCIEDTSNFGTYTKGGIVTQLEATEFLLKASINTALASHSPNYGVISAALRKLVCLAGLHDFSGSMSDAAYDLFRQAYQIVVGLKDGEYLYVGCNSTTYVYSYQGEWTAS
jgi:hypothetical protein